MDTLKLFEDLLTRRHSCRAFRADPVPRAVIERVLLAAGQTASWCNAQPWYAHVVSGEPLEQLRKDLMARARAGASASPELDWPNSYTGLYQERRRACGWQLYDAVGVAHGDKEGSARQGLENFRLFGAPHLVVVTSPTFLGTHGVMDCGAWVSNFLLAATAQGLGTIAQAAVASWPDILRSHLDLAVDHRVVCGISFGYENEAHPANGFRTARAPLTESVAWVGLEASI